MLVDILPPDKNEIQIQFLIVRRLRSSGFIRYDISIVSQPEAYKKPGGPRSGSRPNEGTLLLLTW
jgi:hypothetical protein